MVTLISTSAPKVAIRVTQGPCIYGIMSPFYAFICIMHMPSVLEFYPEGQVTVKRMHDQLKLNCLFVW